MKRFFLFIISIAIISVTINAKLDESFYRIRSYSVPDDYLRIVYDTINAQTIVGSAGNMFTESGRDAAMNRAQKFIQMDIKTIKSSEIFTDPGSVIYLKKKNSSSSKDFDLQSQGVGVLYMSTAKFHGSNAGDIGINGSYAKLEETSSGSGVYKASITMTAVIYSMTRYLGNSNSTLILSKSVGEAGNEYWYLEPINSTNYFAAAPVEEFAMNGKYYTSLRTAFSYTVPTNSGNEVKAYKVTALPDVPGELATIEEVSSVNAGFPVIIESTSLDSEKNRLEPCIPVAYLEASNSGSCSITSNGFDQSNILYHNYGRHGHDAYTDSNHSSFTGWFPEGDNIGFFKNKYPWNTSNVIYKLGIKDGAVGFWNKVGYLEEVSGNEAYSPVQCQLFPVEKELADIGAQDISYKVTNPLIVAYEYVKNNGERVIYAKDKNGKPQQSPGVGEIDFMKLHYADNTYHDHSNWVAIETGTTPSVRPGDSRIKVTGKVLESSPNLRMKASLFEEIDQNGDFNPNTYCVLNFMDKSYHSTANNNFFFATPQANEIADIIWAQWDGNDTFIVPPHSGFTGGIKVDFSMYEGELPVLQDEHEYSFRGLIEKLEPSANAIASKDVETISSLYKVYPLNNLVDMEDIATGVTNNVATSKVVSVKYYNVMGVASDEPFEGVNIVVTTYDNGIRTTSKILK